MIMLVTVGVMGSFVVLKGIFSSHEDLQGAVVATETNPVEVVVHSNSPVKLPGTNIVATTPTQDHEAAVVAQLDKIKEALLDGGADPHLVEAIREQLSHPEAEVRKAAVEALMHLNDRGAIPKLKEALARVQDSREKASIMDAIDYLEIPEDSGQMAGGIANVGSDPPSSVTQPLICIPRTPNKAPTEGGK